MHFDTNLDRTFLRLNIEDVVVFCHGLPYQPGSVLEKGYDNLSKWFSERGKTSLIFDFSGTGLSRGSFSLSAWVEDLEKIINRFETVDIVAFSLGGVPASYVSSRKNVRRLCLVSTPCCFDHISILDKIYLNARSKGSIKGIGSYNDFISKIRRDMERLEPLKWIGESRNTMIVHGTADDTIPFESGEMLYNAASKPKYFLKVVNGGHALRQELEVIKEIFDWLSDSKKEIEGVKKIVI